MYETKKLLLDTPGYLGNIIFDTLKLGFNCPCPTLVATYLERDLIMLYSSSLTLFSQPAVALPEATGSQDRVSCQEQAPLGYVHGLIYQQRANLNQVLHPPMINTVQLR